MTITMLKSALFVLATLLLSFWSVIATVFSILLSIAGFIWFGNQIKHKSVDEHYDGSWWKWFKNWLGFKSMDK